MRKGTFKDKEKEKKNLLDHLLREKEEKTSKKKKTKQKQSNILNTTPSR